MAISGYLSEFSLAEVFQLLDQGNKTGRLSIHERSHPSSHEGQRVYIWFRQGLVVAAANRLDGQGLLSLMQNRGWINARVATRITEVCGINQPTGLCLKSQGVLEAEQLKLLFSQQVLQQVCKLFELQDGHFEFDSETRLPCSEMTGLTAPSKEVALASLRALRNWATLEDKLPDRSSGLASIISGKPRLRLNQLEWQVWEFANGNVSIQEIAQHLQIPVEKIQQVAFRLMVVGMVEEIPPIASSLEPQSTFEMAFLEAEAGGNAAQNTVSRSFLHNLVGFLKGKASV